MLAHRAWCGCAGQVEAELVGAFGQYPLGQNANPKAFQAIDEYQIDQPL